jgi:predicted DNA-binding transcriptional regulator AlpA
VNKRRGALFSALRRQISGLPPGELIGKLEMPSRRPIPVARRASRFRGYGESEPESAMPSHEKPQIAIAEKAAKLKAKASKPALSPTLRAANEAQIAEAAMAADEMSRQHNEHHVHGARAPPVRLLHKGEVLAIVGVTYPTLWAWMRQGRFPRSRIVGAKSMWLSTEVEHWLAGLPVRRLKGDLYVETVAEGARS